MIKIEGLTCGYGRKNVLEEISMEVKKHSVCGLLGANGAGKSTLMKCIMGYIRPVSGEAYLDGAPVSKLSESDIAKKVAYVPQNSSIPFSFTVMDIVLMGRTPHLGGVYGPKKSDYEICMHEIENVGLIDLVDRPFENLSGGQQQLVILARAFAQGTSALVLDEPTASLDYKNQMKFWEMIMGFARKGNSVFVSLHDPNHAMWFCDHVVALGNREVIADGKPDEVITSDSLREIYDHEIDVSQTTGSLKVIVPKLQKTGKS